MVWDNSVDRHLSEHAYMEYSGENTQDAQWLERGGVKLVYGTPTLLLSSQCEKK